MMTHQVRRCLLCHDVDIEIGVEGRFVTTTCRACFAVLLIEFDPPDEPSLKARIERLDEPEDSRTATLVRSKLTRDAHSGRAN
jgi:hypothetical protein